MIIQSGNGDKNIPVRVLYINTVCIKPGVNMFDEADTKKLLSAKKTIDGVPTLKIIDKPEQEDGNITSSVQLNQKDLLKLISNTTDVVTLKKMMADEEASGKNRQRVFLAIEKQAKKVDEHVKVALDDEEEEE